MNDLGVVVGFAYYPGDLVGRGFVYYGSGSIEDLNTLIGPSSGWRIDDADAINDSGQIAAEGYYGGSGDAHAVLLTPIDDAGTVNTLATLRSGFGLYGNSNRRTFIEAVPKR